MAAPTPLSPPPSMTNLFIIYKLLILGFEYYLNFNVTMVKTAKRIPIIQKRTTILLS
jgi:hypothetical protein